MRKSTLSGLASATNLAVGLFFTAQLAVPVLAAGAEVHWSYEGAEGPEHWGDLSPDFKVCGTGREQTPINVPASAPVNPADIAFNYQPSAETILNNGHTVQVNYDTGSSIAVGGKTYDLVQFHFHAPSEHTVDRSHTPMEMHLVHKAADGQLAVVGVMLKEGAENANFAAVLDHLPVQEAEPAAVPGVKVAAADLLPAERSYYRYHGSLTTPPCTEGVQWLLMKTPVELSANQIAEFTRIFSDDARPEQALNGRPFLLTSSMASAKSVPAAEVAAPTKLPATGGEAPSWGFALTALGLLLTGMGALRMREGLH